MLVFNEGVPRAGKSYDAVKTHILPALQGGRRVFARLNGLDHEAIARYLGMPEQRVRDLLVLVDSENVKTFFACELGEGGKWVIRDELKDALVVIDEVHEFYVQDRQPLPPQQENFFALIGQNGGDVVIMTQWIKRVHSAVRARIERKNVFQKLTAVGAKSRYRVTYFHTTSPDKYERVGGSTEKYDPDIYPLYHGYAPGSGNVEVYTTGGRSVWRSMLGRALIIVPLGVFAIWYLLNFFSGGGAAMVKDSPATKAAPSGVYQVADTPTAVAPAVRPRKLTPKEEKELARDKAMAALTPEQRYVIELGETARPRVTYMVRGAGIERAQVEWVNTSGLVTDRMDLDTLRSLNVKAEVMGYGVRLSAGDQVVVITQWPRDLPARDVEARLYDTSQGQQAGLAPASDSELPPTPAAVVGATDNARQVQRYGSFGERSLEPAEGYTGGNR